MISKTPEPPYYAVIFTSVRTNGDHGYKETAANMLKLAAAPARLFRSRKRKGHEWKRNNGFLLGKP